MHFDFSLEDIHTRGGILDKFMDTAFDASILVDRDGIVIHSSRGSQKLVNFPREMMVGRHISKFDDQSPFDRVIRTGKAETGIIIVVKGRNCMTNLVPVISEGTVIAVLGMMLYRSLTTLNKVLAGLAEHQNNDAAQDLYNTIARVESNYTFEDFIGKSRIITELLDQCRKTAGTIYPILLIGETGTGKEILASAFHSEHAAGKLTPFVKINCTAIPYDLLESELFGHEKGAFTGAGDAKKGKFEIAAGGTILLDEIGDMDLQLQSKLLRVLEEKEYERIGGTKLIPLNARIIASTNKNLRELCGLGKFRPDLYYRLSTIEIKVPPLRNRSADIPLLVDHILDQDDLNLHLSKGGLRVLKQYQWPGNVRELRNVLNRLSINKPLERTTAEDVKKILANDPESDWQDFSNPHDKVRHYLSEEDYSLETRERTGILRALENNNFNISQTAKQLKICRATLYNKIKKHEFKLKKRFESA